MTTVQQVTDNDTGLPQIASDGFCRECQTRPCICTDPTGNCTGCDQRPCRCGASPPADDPAPPLADTRRVRPGPKRKDPEPYRSPEGTWENGVRKSVLEDPSLSVWAFRLLLYMITKPEDFVFIPGVLMRDGNLPRGPRGGRTWIVEEALPELRKAGFVEPVQARRPDGTLGRGGTWRLVRDMAIVPEQEGAGSRQAVKGGHREAGRFRRSQPLVRQPHFAS